ncbi:DUF2013 domain containing protein-like protein [Dinothrombium tinctorium]|uniref:DUF2013 domain containing protein-like protein n=1 Tax=Dinothrombium tinctorium TaxID=1965070 RepID=A0A3S3P1Y4_9ACAR|nr:DUF2013 domain containing protein-like protein [Dinothrombium tinctorium]RWS03282.1 DUF2013 domain containing protein-like protein [Dinothrombium tinctorium]RWS03357.1 DUF2013 domain containing protein-like protein [Dinothrombium tinctorium]
MESECFLVKALYDYEAIDAKVLNCTADERFIVIKHSNEWLYVVNTNGRLGYIPANYVQSECVDDNEFLAFIDSVVSLLDAKHNDCNTITTRQINHAQVKLTQIRCEVIQRISQEASCSPAAVHKAPVNGEHISDAVHSHQREVIESNEVAVQTDNFELDTSCGNLNGGQQSVSSDIPHDFIPNLIERIRVSTELSHNMCKLTAETVIKFLKEMIPSFEASCNIILEQLNDENVKCPSPDVMRQSSDLINLNSLFRKLWFCKNDEQQRSWPVHEDEDTIESYLKDIAKLFINANPSISREVICKHGYDNVHMLVTYFQMETRKRLRMRLYTVLFEIIRLADQIIPDYMLNSVLPSALANEMLNHYDDVERFTNAALLFTAIFSTGHKPPINIYEHINDNFIDKLLKLIEGEDFDGNKSVTKIPPETSIPPILSFNLHFDDPESNLVLKALKKRINASQLTEILVSHLNWEEDPSRLSHIVGKVNNVVDSMERPNAVHKMLIEIFDSPEIAKIFYYNDVRVLVDIIVTHLNNLLPGDKSRISYLKLALNIIKNTNYSEEPHKLEEVLKCLNFITNDENSSEEEKQLTHTIKQHLPAE